MQNLNTYKSQYAMWKMSTTNPRSVKGLVQPQRCKVLCLSAFQHLTSAEKTVCSLYLHSIRFDLRMPLPPLFDNSTPLRMIHFLFW